MRCGTVRCRAMRCGTVRCDFGDVEGLRQERHAPPTEDQTVAWRRPCATLRSAAVLICSLARSLPASPPQRAGGASRQRERRKMNNDYRKR